MTTDYLPVCFRARCYGDVRTVVVVSGRPGRQPTWPMRRHLTRYLGDQPDIVIIISTWFPFFRTDKIP